MTVGAWVSFALIAGIIWFFAILGCVCFEIKGRIASIAAAVVFTGVILWGMLWFFNNTASGRRALIDQRSDLANGLDRVVTVYTADGEVIAKYEGKIDIETNDGGYIKFDFEGKRYIYYNCFVESIAEIE